MLPCNSFPKALSKINRRSLMRQFFKLFKDSAIRFVEDKVPRMAAALSYYTAFSIAPLLLLVIAIAGFVLGRQAAQGQISKELTGLVGQQSAATVQSIIQAANKPKAGAIATLISIISLIAGATGVLSELKE